MLTIHPCIIIFTNSTFWRRNCFQRSCDVCQDQRASAWRAQHFTQRSGSSRPEPGEKLTRDPDVEHSHFYSSSKKQTF